MGNCIGLHKKKEETEEYQAKPNARIEKWLEDNVKFVNDESANTHYSVEDVVHTSRLSSARVHNKPVKVPDEVVVSPAIADSVSPSWPGEEEERTQEGTSATGTTATASSKAPLIDPNHLSPLERKKDGRMSTYYTCSESVSETSDSRLRSNQEDASLRVVKEENLDETTEAYLTTDEGDLPSPVEEARSAPVESYESVVEMSSPPSPSRSPCTPEKAQLPMTICDATCEEDPGFEYTEDEANNSEENLFEAKDARCVRPLPTPMRSFAFSPGIESMVDRKGRLFRHSAKVQEFVSRKRLFE